MAEDLESKYITIKMREAISIPGAVRPYMDTNMTQIEQVALLSMLFQNHPDIAVTFFDALTMSVDPNTPGPVGREKRYGKQR